MVWPFDETGQDFTDAQYSMYTDRPNGQDSQRTFSRLGSDHQSTYSNPYSRPVSERSNKTPSSETKAPFFKSTLKTQVNDNDKTTQGLSFLDDVRRERMLNRTSTTPSAKSANKSFDFNQLGTWSAPTKNEQANNRVADWDNHRASSLYPKIDRIDLNYGNKFPSSNYNQITSGPKTPPLQNERIDLSNPPDIRKPPNTTGRLPNHTYHSPSHSFIPDSVYDIPIPGSTNFLNSHPISQATPIKQRPTTFSHGILTDLRYEKDQTNKFQNERHSNSISGLSESYNPFMRRVSQRTRYPSHNENAPERTSPYSSHYNYNSGFNRPTDRAESMVSNFTETSKYMHSLLPVEFPGKLPKEYKHAPEMLKKETHPFASGAEPFKNTDSFIPLKPLNNVFLEMNEVGSGLMERYRVLMDSGLPGTMKPKDTNYNGYNGLSSNKNKEINAQHTENQNQGFFSGLFGANKSGPSDLNNTVQVVNQGIQTDSFYDQEKAQLVHELLKTRMQLLEARKAATNTFSPSASSKINKEQALQIEQAMNDQFLEQKKHFQEKQKALKDEHNTQTQKLYTLLESSEVRAHQLKSELDQVKLELQETRENQSSLHDYAFKKDKEYEEIKEKCGKAIKAHTHFLNLYASGTLPKPKVLSTEDAEKYRSNKSAYSSQLDSRAVVDEKEMKKVFSNLEKLATDVNLYADEHERRAQDLANFKSAIHELERDIERERAAYENEIAKINYTLDDERESQKMEHAVIVRQLNRKLEQSKEMHEKEVRELKKQIESNHGRFNLLGPEPEQRLFKDQFDLDDLEKKYQKASLVDDTNGLGPQRRGTNSAKSWAFNTPYTTNELRSSTRTSNTAPSVPDFDNGQFTFTGPLSSTSATDKLGLSKRPVPPDIKTALKTRPVSAGGEERGTRVSDIYSKNRYSVLSKAPQKASSTSTASTVNISTNFDTDDKLYNEQFGTINTEYDALFSKQPFTKQNPLSSLPSSYSADDALKVGKILGKLYDTLSCLHLDTAFSSASNSSEAIVISEIKQRSTEMFDFIYKLKKLVRESPGVSKQVFKSGQVIFEDVMFLLEEIPELKRKVLEELERQNRNLDSGSDYGLTKDGLKKVYGQILGHLHSASSKLGSIYNLALSNI